MKLSRVLTSTLLVILVFACAGVGARDHVLLPAARQAWVGIERDVQRGVADLPKREQELVLAESAKMGSLLASGDRSKLRTVNWTVLREAALRGIQVRQESGEVGPGVADSLRERVRLFDEGWKRLEARP